MTNKLILSQKLALVGLLLLSVAAAVLTFVSLEVSIIFVSLALLALGGLVYLSGRNLVQSVRTVVRQEDRAVKERDQQIKSQLAKVAQIVGRTDSAQQKAAGNIAAKSPELPRQVGVGDAELMMDIYTELRGVQNALSGLRAEQAGIRHELLTTNDRLTMGIEASSFQD